ncbi:hypothetical protein Tco_1329972 [Tanacetum coccineum]
MTSHMNMIGQYMQKKEEEKLIAEEQADKNRYWKIPICYDDDDDEESSILGLGSLDRIESGDSSGASDPSLQAQMVETLRVIIDMRREMSDMQAKLLALGGHQRGARQPGPDARSPDSELASLDVVEIVIPKVRGIDTYIHLTIKDDILYEKLLNVNLLIVKIEALKDNPTPSSDFVTKSSSTSLNFFLEETNTFNNSLPESETFCFNLEEIGSGSPTSYLDLSLPDYEAFFCDSEPNSGNFTMDVVEDIFDNPTREPRVHVPNVLPTLPTHHLDSDFTLCSDSLGSDLVVSFPSETRNKIFDPGIFIKV